MSDTHWGSQPIPHHQEAEEAAIGSLFINPHIYLDLKAILDSADNFFILRHKYIWQAIERVAERGDAIDYMTVVAELKAMDKLAEIGGPAYLTQLINSVPTHLNFETYARLVVRAADRRRVLAYADEVKAMALNEDISVEEVFLEAHQRLDVLTPENRSEFTRGLDSIQDYDNARDEIARRRASGQLVSYPWPENWGPVADLIPAIFPGDFMIISGLEGSGKSSALEQLAEHLATLKLPTQYIHTEMSKEDVLHRRMARHSGVPFDVLKSGTETHTQVTLTVEADLRIQSSFAPHISYKWFPDVKFADLQVWMKQQQKAGVKAFVIDHFQDIEVATGRDENPVRGYEKAVKWLAAFAEFNHILVILASQENQQGKTKWSSKLLEKALTRISIKSRELTKPEEYIVSDPATGTDTEIHYKVGEIDPFHSWHVTKARFGKKGKARMFNQGSRFRWVDPVLVSRPQPKVPAHVEYAETFANFTAATEPSEPTPLYEPPVKSSAKESTGKRKPKEPLVQ